MSNKCLLNKWAKEYVNGYQNHFLPISQDSKMEKTADDRAKMISAKQSDLTRTEAQVGVQPAGGEPPPPWLSVFPLLRGQPQRCLPLWTLGLRMHTHCWAKAFHFLEVDDTWEGNWEMCPSHEKWCCFREKKKQEKKEKKGKKSLWRDHRFSILSHILCNDRSRFQLLSSVPTSDQPAPYCALSILSRWPPLPSSQALCPLFPLSPSPSHISPLALCVRGGNLVEWVATC